MPKEPYTDAEVEARLRAAATDSDPVEACERGETDLRQYLDAGHEAIRRGCSDCERYAALAGRFQAAAVGRRVPPLSDEPVDEPWASIRPEQWDRYGEITKLLAPIREAVVMMDHDQPCSCTKTQGPCLMHGNIDRANEVLKEVAHRLEGLESVRRCNDPCPLDGELCDLWPGHDGPHVNACESTEWKNRG